MSDGVKWVIGLALIVALGILGIHGGRLGGASSARAQEKLEARVNERLVGIGSRWARVEMRGQRAILSGVAPSEEELALTRGAVRSAVWNGGWLLGGVTGVTSDEARIVSPRVGPYAWRAEIDGARVRLSGAAPDRDAADALERFAGALFPSRAVINDQTLDPLPPGDDWDDAARGALVILSYLSVGQVDLSDFELLAAGLPKDAAAAEGARRSLRRLGRTVSATSRLELATVEPATPAVALDTVAPRRADPEPVEPEDDAETDAGDAPATDETEEASADTADAEAPARPVEGAARDCQTRFDAALADQSVTFDTGSAALSADSLPLLDALAALALDCAPYKLHVEGHTDDTGVADLNQVLSEQRAAAVVARLEALGVADERMTSQGFGAERPVASNETSEGRRANRRIEIIVFP